MYFPYLRGKQNELLALKELAPLLGEAGKVFPIIEPVRDPNGSGLLRCVDSLIEGSVEFTLIVNPKVGTLKVESSIAPLLSDFVKTNRKKSQSWNLGLIIDEGTDIDSLLNDYKISFGTKHKLMLIHLKKAKNLELLLEKSDQLNRRYDVLESRLRIGHFRNFLSNSNAITLNDFFPAQERNSDYLKSSESIFSEENIFYEEDKWFGFSDYLTIGVKFEEAGFMPRAVVIHWTFQKSEGEPILIRHFTSDSNEDTSNVAGKFLEALEKLIRFLDVNDTNTKASVRFKELFRNQHYPGLGIIKKLSMQNHLELVSTILSK